MRFLNNGAERVRIDGYGRLQVNMTSNVTGTAKLEVMGTGDNSYPMYSYGIGVADTQAYNVSNGAGMGIGFSYKHNSGGSYALGCGIRGFKENTTDGDYAGAMAFYTRPNGSGAVERMRISSEGYVTIPNPPSFAVYRNQQSWTIADGGKMNFNTARHNIGNHYDLSNGRFIAPVTGSYQLNFYSIVQGNYTNAYIQLKVNGNRIYGGDTHWTLTNNSGNWHNVSYSQVVYLTASQYVEIFSYTGTGSGNVVWHGNNWGCFSGYLIG